jgi:uncharacterized membrane protein YccC
MKADQRISGHHNLSHHHELPSPEHVLDRIRTITGELDALRAEIYGQTTDPGELLARRALLEHAGASAVMDKFKASLDHLRSILWFCAADVCDSRLSPDLRSDRERQLARAAELLNALAPAGFPPASTREGSFFERLDRVIDNYMEAFPQQKPGRRSKA